MGDPPPPPVGRPTGSLPASSSWKCQKVFFLVPGIKVEHGRLFREGERNSISCMPTHREKERDRVAYTPPPPPPRRAGSNLNLRWPPHIAHTRLGPFHLSLSLPLLSPLSKSPNWARRFPPFFRIQYSRWGHNSFPYPLPVLCGQVFLVIIQYPSFYSPRREKERSQNVANKREAVMLRLLRKGAISRGTLLAPKVFSLSPWVEIHPSPLSRTWDFYVVHAAAPRRR